jgi:hypothetical protein
MTVAFYGAAEWIQHGGMSASHNQLHLGSPIKMKAAQ